MSNNDTQRILWYLEDDPTTGRKGLYSMITSLQNDHKVLLDRVQKVEEAQRFDKWRYTAVGGVVGGGSFALLKWFLAKLSIVIF